MTARRHWLVEVELDGQVKRWSVEHLEVETSAGEVLVYRSGLVELELAQGSDGASIELLDPEVDWPALGGELECRTCTVLRWREGDVFEQAEVFARGEARGVAYGSRRERVSWTISETGGAAASLGVQVPDPLAQVDLTTWSAPPDEGAPYPVIFGYPGYTGATNPVCVVPAPLGSWNALDADTNFVVCEDGDAQITQVRVRNAEEDAEANEAVAVESDLLGRRIRVGDFASAGGPKPVSASAARGLFMGFTPSGGGGVARSAYDVIAYLLRRWGVDTVDWTRLPEVRDFLGVFQVDTWIDEPQTDPWAWIEGVLLVDLPLEVRRTERGRYLVQRHYRTDPRRLVGTVSVDRGEARRRSGRTRVTEEGPYNEFTALYRRNINDDWLGRIILTGDPDTIQAAPTLTVPPPVATVGLVNTLPSSLCRLSHARYQLRQDEQIEIDWTWDTGTVVRVLELRAERYALPADLIEYDILDGEDLREGNELRLVDEEMALDLAVIVEEPPVVTATSTSCLLRIPGEG